MTGAEQQDDVGGEFLVGELLTILLGLHQLRGEVVAGLLAAQLEQLMEIHRRHRVAGVALLDFLRRHRYRLEQPSAVARAVIERLTMLLGDAEHIADDRHRQAEREILDQVHPALRNDAVERLVDDVLNARAHVLDPARGERLDDETAQAGMIRRVLLQHPVAHAAHHRFVHDLGTVAADRALDIVLAEPLVAQHEARLGVPARDESAVRIDMHRIEAPHPLVIRIGIADEFGGQWIEKRLAARRLNLLVHGDLVRSLRPVPAPWRALVSSSGPHLHGYGHCGSVHAIRYTLVSSCILP